jgi:glycosyltransferase involved in cell wall biosynthesis
MAPRPGPPGVVSVVIPTLNEAPRLAPLLAALRADPWPSEVIVADGGSEDGTADAARAAGATQVLVAPRGRGAQLGAGLALAGGETVLMLHADTRPRRGIVTAVGTALAAAPVAVGGNFRLLFDGGTRFDAWLGGFYAWLRRRGLFYGDSGIFVRRAVLEAVGGVRPIALMEDFDLVRRLRAAGPLLCIDDPPLVTSSRRFAGRHPVRIVAGWAWLHARHLAGADASRLARAYDSERRRCAGG